MADDSFDASIAAELAAFQVRLSSIHMCDLTRLTQENRDGADHTKGTQAEQPITQATPHAQPTKKQSKNNQNQQKNTQVRPETNQKQSKKTQNHPRAEALG